MKALKPFSIVVALLVLLFCSYDLVLAQPRWKILVAYVAPGITQTIPWVTKEVGVFAKHGIDAEVILLTGSPRLVQTLLSGDVEHARGGVFCVVRALPRSGSGYFGNDDELLRPKSFASTRVSP